MFTNLEDFQNFGKEQFEAASAAASTLSKGVQELAAEATEYSKQSLADTTAVFEKLLGAKSIDTAFQIQSDFAKTAYEGWVAKSTRFGEMYVNLAKETFKPVEAVMSKAMVVR